MIRNKNIFPVLAMLMSVALAMPAMAEQDTGNETENAGSSIESNLQKEQEICDAYVSYLTQNKDSINVMEQMFTVEDYAATKGRPIALYDVDGNGIPEMFVFQGDATAYFASLKILTYTDKGIEEIAYAFDTDENAMFSTPEYHYAHAGSDNYIVWIGKDDNALYIYDSNGDEWAYEVVKKYTMDGNALNNEYTIRFEEDYLEGTEVYYENGTEIDGATGAQKLAEVYDTMGTVLLYSGADFLIGEPWDHCAASTFVGMSYDEMYEFLVGRIEADDSTADIGNDTVETGTDAAAVTDNGQLPESITGKELAHWYSPRDGSFITFQENGTFSYVLSSVSGGTGEGEYITWNISTDQVSQISDTVYQLHVDGITAGETYDFSMADNTRADKEADSDTCPFQVGATITLTLPGASESDVGTLDEYEQSFDSSYYYIDGVSYQLNE